MVAKYTHTMKSLFAFLLLMFGTIFCSAQNNSSVVLKDAINKNLAKLYTFPETLETGDSFDPDSLSNIIAQQLITYIKDTGLDNFDTAFFDNLELAYRKSDEPFWVLSFSYYSGRTAGLIPTSIIIKEDANEYTYYNMNEYEASFYDFYSLGNNLYLCFASIPGSGICANNGIYVFDFNKEAKPVAVFNDKSFISLCNSDLSFDQATKTLTIEVNNIPYYNEGDDYNAYFDKEGLNFFKIEPSEISNSDFMGTLISVFDGHQFVKP